MIELVEHVLDSYSRGLLSRRRAVLAVLGMVAAGGSRSAVAAPPNAATFRATGLNHLGLRVTDVARSRDFYRERFGASVLQDNGPHGPCFLRTGEHYLGLFPASTPAVDHFCFTVDAFDADDAMHKLRASGHTPHREEDRVYLTDPDGLKLQVDSRYGSWPGEPPDGAD